VVEVRRLELLTPYMQKAEDKEEDPPEKSDDDPIHEDDAAVASPDRPHNSTRVR
jgi:hypothetical protein